jgi:hypothetical protein
MKKTDPITWENDPSLIRARAAKQNPILDNKRKAIAPNGDVVEISLASGRKVPVAHNLYKLDKTAAKEKKGFVWYDSLPEVEREALIASRQAEHIEKQSKLASQFAGDKDRLLQKMDDLVSAMASSNESAPPVRGRK